MNAPQGEAGKRDQLLRPSLLDYKEAVSACAEQFTPHKCRPNKKETRPDEVETRLRECYVA